MTISLWIYNHLIWHDLTQIEVFLDIHLVKFAKVILHIHLPVYSLTPLSGCDSLIIFGTRIRCWEHRWIDTSQGIFNTIFLLIGLKSLGRVLRLLNRLRHQMNVNMTGWSQILNMPTQILSGSLSDLDLRVLIDLPAMVLRLYLLALRRKPLWCFDYLWSDCNHLKSPSVVIDVAVCIAGDSDARRLVCSALEIHNVKLFRRGLAWH